jgi:hypothetical protein
VATQSLDGISEGLRAALLANCAVTVLFRLDHAGARLAAPALAAVTRTRVTRIAISADRLDRETGKPELAEWAHPVCDPWGKPVRLRPDYWQALVNEAGYYPVSLSQICRVARECRWGRLYVRVPGTDDVREIRHYLKALSREWYRFEGPELRLITLFPRPKLSRVERLEESDATRQWARQLQDLPVRHAVLRLPEVEPAVVRITEVPTPRVAEVARTRYREAVTRVNGQPQEEVLAALRWRETNLDRVGQREVPDDPPTVRAAPSRKAKESKRIAPPTVTAPREEETDESLF